MKSKIRIGGASAFWGDTSSAAPQLVKKGNLDYLVFDYLAEVTMSILAGAKMKNPNFGYATDFVKTIGPLLKEINGNGIKVISNAGGINPEACRAAVLKEANKAGVELKIAIVNGDNLIGEREKLMNLPVAEIETGKPMPNSILSINAYLGAPGIKKALEEDADMVISGRCVDSAVVLGPLMHEFGWTTEDYDLLASGSLAGHIIECGTQCTGGNFTDWHLVQGFENMGFPIVEVESNGDFVVTKPEATGGLVSKGSVAEQFLYEIGDPSAYILPDVVCDFTNVTIKEVGTDCVLVSGAKGFPPTDSYKVSATYMDGFRVGISVVIIGIEATEKARVISESIIKKTRNMFTHLGLKDYTDTHISILGAESTYGENAKSPNPREVVLRLMATHTQKEALVLLSREIAHASTGMAPGLTSMGSGRPSVSPSIRLYSFLIPKKDIEVSVNIEENKFKVSVSADGGYSVESHIDSILLDEIVETDASVPLVKLAYARSGDKGDHANIGVIARKAHYLPFITRGLTTDSISEYFSHVLKGNVFKWEVPGINGLNFLLKNSLGGGGMASLNIDPQGKAYAQQLLEYPIPISKEIMEEIKLQ